MRRFQHVQVTPSLVISMVALFVACGGTAIAATGGNLILGAANTADKQTGLTSSAPGGAALKVTTTTAQPAASFVTPAGTAPIAVSNTTKVAKLNADLLDGVDSAGFLRKVVPLVFSGADANAVLQVANSGLGNGIQGTSQSSTASGVYGENDAGGYGVAGRSSVPDGTALYGEALGGGLSHGLVASSDGPGAAIVATNTNGPALDLQSSIPMTVDSTFRVENLNADMVDYASILSNRIITTTANAEILAIPGFGALQVLSCTGGNASFDWTAETTGPVYLTGNDLYHINSPVGGITAGVTFPPAQSHEIVMQLARNTGSSTQMVSITATSNGSDCVFAAQAIVQPG